MRKLPKTLVWIVSVIGIAILALAVEFLRFGGVFSGVTPRFDGSCRAIALEGSSEDIQIDRERGIAYLSFLDRDVLYHSGSGNGTVLMLDLNLDDPAPRAAMSRDPADFRPHGLSLFPRPGQPERLFAVSHSPTGEAVEIAERDSNGAFVPLRTVHDKSFTHPNAVAAVGPEQFYLVNDHPVQTRWQQRWSLLTRAGNGTLLYYDGAQVHLAADGLVYPAGLAVSPDGARVYVGEFLAKALRVYRRDPASGQLTLERTVALGSAPDNINVDSDGVVWIAAHPKLLKFLAHWHDSKRPAPTQVLRFDPRQPAAGAVQIYADDGSRIAAGTVAARWRDEFLIGALLDRKVLICKPR